MKLWHTKEERQERRAARKDRRRKHRIAMAVILHQDRTYTMMELDIDSAPALANGERYFTFDGYDYHLPSIPYDLSKWWPFKARTLKRYIMPDDHFIIVWNECQWKSIDIGWAHEHAEHTNINPTSWKAMISERGMASSVASMKAKSKLGLDNKWMLLIIVGVVALAIVLILGTGVIG